MSYLLRGTVDVNNEVEVKNDLNNPLRVTVENGPTSPAVVEIANDLHISSGNVNAYITSGNINAFISSGNVNAYITSGNVHVSSGLIQIMNSGAVVSPSNPLPVTVNSGITFASDNVDAFGRLRVSNPFTLFDSQHRYKINEKWNYLSSGGGSTSYDANSSVVNLNTDLNSGTRVVGETKRVMAYQPGKSLLIYSTFTMCSGQVGQVQRCGYFGANNGIYFEMNGVDPTFVLRSSITGTMVETRVTKSFWNVDQLDGSGPSAIALNNFSSSMILYIDIEWLGVGDVRVGFILGGKYVHCHTFKHTPTSPTPISGTYMTTAC